MTDLQVPRLKTDHFKDLMLTSIAAIWLVALFEWSHFLFPVSLRPLSQGLIQKII